MAFEQPECHHRVRADPRGPRVSPVRSASAGRSRARRERLEQAELARREQVLRGHEPRCHGHDRLRREWSGHGVLRCRSGGERAARLGSPGIPNTGDPAAASQICGFPRTGGWLADHVDQAAAVGPATRSRGWPGPRPTGSRLSRRRRGARRVGAVHRTAGTRRPGHRAVHRQPQRERRLLRHVAGRARVRDRRRQQVVVPRPQRATGGRDEHRHARPALAQRPSSLPRRLRGGGRAARRVRRRRHVLGRRRVAA